MTTVPSTTGTGTSTTTSTTQSTSGAKAAVDYQSFLKLLVAEMKNQDPTNPMDSTQYVAQLAAFSQVEQSVQLNSKLTSLLQSSAVSQADSLLGHMLTSADGTVTGMVAAVKLTASGNVAVLASGAEIKIENGITVQ